MLFLLCGVQYMCLLLLFTVSAAPHSLTFSAGKVGLYFDVILLPADGLHLDVQFGLTYDTCRCIRPLSTGRRLLWSTMYTDSRDSSFTVLAQSLSDRSRTLYGHTTSTSEAWPHQTSAVCICGQRYHEQHCRPVSSDKA